MTLNRLRFVFSFFFNFLFQRHVLMMSSVMDQYILPTCACDRVLTHGRKYFKLIHSLPPHQFHIKQYPIWGESLRISKESMLKSTSCFVQSGVGYEPAILSKAIWRSLSASWWSQQRTWLAGSIIDKTRTRNTVMSSSTFYWYVINTMNFNPLKSFWTLDIYRFGHQLKCVTDSNPNS